MTDLETRIKEEGANKAPRLTPAHIESKIQSVSYINAGEAVTANGEPFHDSLRLLTICVIVLENGFTVTGESACASPENYNATIGQEVAYENAVEKIWLLEGYSLKQRLHEEAQTKAQLADFKLDDCGDGCKI